MKRSRLLIGLLLIAGVALIALLNMFSSPAMSLGVVDGQLGECPETPNCVCSQSQNASQRVEPFQFSAPPDVVWAALEQTVRAYPRSRIVEQTETYMRCEFRTAIMRFVDDVEFLLDATSQAVHVRSASRLGYSDMGTNRSRVERIFDQLGIA